MKQRLKLYVPETSENKYPIKQQLEITAANVNSTDAECCRAENSTPPPCVSLYALER